MNLEKECRRGYVISVEMKKIWSIQIAMLNKLLEVCKKYHLDIWADSGTLLGAVREKGYIPWDDDIDMVMMRKDYNRLVEVSKNEFLDPYFFQCMFTEKHYHRGHAQLRMKGTTAILPGDINECFDKYYAMLNNMDNTSYGINANMVLFAKEKGMYRDISLLSAGKKDIAGLCFRMALIGSMYKGERPFLILDDPFVNMDDESVLHAMEFTKIISREYQVIYFTCHRSRCIE